MTDLPENIIAFNAVAGAVLLALYRSHPTPIDLSKTEALVDVPGVFDDDLFENTVTWLRDHGFLRYGMGPGIQPIEVVFSRIQLSERGLATLANPLPSLTAAGDRPKPIGAQLVDAAKRMAAKGAGVAATDLAKLEFVHLVMRLFGS